MGNIQIIAQEDVTFAGGRQNGILINGEFASIVSGANVTTSGAGNGGNIEITTGALVVRDGAKPGSRNFSGIFR